MRMLTAFVGVESRHWERVLAEVEHDFYHLRGYVRLCSGLDGGEPVAFLAERGEHRLLIPLILRPIPQEVGGQGLLDAISPYGYPGPLLSPAAGREAEDFFASAMVEFLRGLQELRVVSAFVRLNPLLGLPEKLLRDFGTLVLHGQTVSIDLGLSHEEIWRQTRENHRRDIRKAEQGCHVVRIRNDLIRQFSSIYEETMDRVGAGEAYYFPPEYFIELQEVLGDRLSVVVVEIAGEPACMGLFVESCGIVQYHLSGTRGEFLKYRPLKTMLNFVRFWAKDRGHRVFHLGGGVGGSNDALFDFKAGFSKARHPFFTWRIHVDEAAYRGLSDRWHALSGWDPDGIEGYFPAYRKPLS